MRKILPILLLSATILTVPVKADFDYSSLDGLTKEELLEIQEEINKRINSFQSEDSSGLEQSDLIEFEDVDVLLSSKANRSAISQALDEYKIPELKVSLAKYGETHADNAIDEIINILDSYGDYEGITKETDYFTGNETTFYNGYKEIDDSHYFRIYYYGGWYIEFGIVRDKRFLTTSATLKIIDQSESWEQIQIWDKYGFKYQILEDGRYLEKAHDYIRDDQIDYLLRDMSGQVVIRFQGRDETFDYELTEEDKAALQNMAKYYKVNDSIRDMMLSTQLID